MAFCNKCGAVIAAGTKFCGACGNKITEEQLELSNQMNTNAHIKDNTQRQTVYDGEVHKCPNCGAILKSFMEKCPECGYELRGASGVESVSDFAKQYEYATTNEQKVSLIRTFVIPNTKEDILEFAILASTNIDAGSYTRENVVVSGGMSQQEVTEAWMAKFEQAYQKAQLLLVGTPELESLEKIFLQRKEELKVSKKNGARKKNRKKIIALILDIIALTMFLVGTFLGSASGDGDSPFHAMAFIGFFPALASIFLWIK